MPEEAMLHSFVFAIKVRIAAMCVEDEGYREDGYIETNKIVAVELTMLTIGKKTQWKIARQKGNIKIAIYCCWQRCQDVASISESILSIV